MRPKRACFVGFGFDRLTVEEVLDCLRFASADVPFRYVVTPNVDHAVRLDRSDGNARAHLLAAYDQAWLCLCDSRVLAKLAQLCGLSLPVCPGSDLTRHVLASVARPLDRICLVGGTEATGDALRLRYPQLVILQHQPPMGLRANPEAMKAAAEFVTRAHARFTFLAVGSPQQELLALQIATDAIARGTALCIGAGIEFLTGHAVRAPQWVQRLSLEWLHRLLSDPARLWRRYLVDGPQIFAIVWRRHRKPE